MIFFEDGRWKSDALTMSLIVGLGNGIEVFSADEDAFSGTSPTGTESGDGKAIKAGGEAFRA